MEKVSSSWLLASRLEVIRGLILSHPAFSFHHVRWDANKVADLLANVGVNECGARRMGRLENFDAKQWMT